MKYKIIATLGITIFATHLVSPEMNFPANSLLWWVEGFIGEFGLYTFIIAISLYSAERFKENRERKYGLLFAFILILCASLSIFMFLYGIDGLNKSEKTLLNGEIQILNMDVSQKSEKFQRTFSRIFATAYYTVNGDKLDYQDSTGKTLKYEPSESEKKHKEIYRNIPILFDLKRHRMQIAGLNYLILIIIVSGIFWTKTNKNANTRQ